MTTTITLPAPGGTLIGPGAPITITTDNPLVGEPDSHWHLRINLSTTPFNYFWIGDHPVSGPNTPITFMTNATNQTRTSAVYPSGETGVLLLAELVVNGVTAEQGSITAQWEPTIFVGNQIALQVPATTGGFTEEDRANVQLAVENTQTPIIDAGTGLLINAGLGRLFDQVPPHLLTRHGNSLHLTGNGSLHAGIEPFAVFTLGIEWIFDQPPPGFGRELGNVTEYERRMVQWMPVFQDSVGSSFWASLVDAHEAGQRLVWGTKVPHDLNYWIAPGLGLTVTFLAFVVQPP